MGNIIDHIQAANVLTVEQEHRLGVLLAEERDQDIRPRNLLLASGLDMEDSPLQDTLKTDGRLGLALFPGWNQGRGLLDEEVNVRS
jgi:hypothetical protein